MTPDLTVMSPGSGFVGQRGPCAPSRAASSAPTQWAHPNALRQRRHVAGGLAVRAFWAVAQQLLVVQLRLPGDPLVLALRDQVGRLKGAQQHREVAPGTAQRVTVFLTGAGEPGAGVRYL